MDEEKEKFNWTRLTIVIIIVLVTAMVVGGTTWYLMDKNAKDIKLENDKSIKELEKTMKSLKENKSAGLPSDDLKNWKIFVGPGFKIKYPSDWKVEENSTDGNIIFANTNVVFANVTKNYAMSLSYGEIFGRGGSCVKRNINYEATVQDSKIMLNQKNDTTSESLAEGEMCGGIELKGFAISTNGFKYNDKNYFAYSYGISSDIAISDEANAYFKKIIGTLEY